MGTRQPGKNQPLKSVNRKMKMPYYLSKNKENGFTLIELLIAMTIGLIILGALSSTFIIQRKTYAIQEQTVEMVQTGRAAMDMMSREIRMAGYDPSGLAGAGIVSAVTDKIYITMDITGGESDGIDNDGDGNVDEADEDKFGDGVLDDSNEHIVYDIYDNKLGRTVGSSANVNNPSVPPYHQPVAENIQSVEFKYWDDSATEYNESTMLSRPVADPANIRVIQITITARTTKPAPDSSGYRTYTLTSFITPRNL